MERAPELVAGFGWTLRRRLSHCRGGHQQEGQDNWERNMESGHWRFPSYKKGGTLASFSPRQVPGLGGLGFALVTLSERETKTNQLSSPKWGKECEAV